MKCTREDLNRVKLTGRQRGAVVAGSTLCVLCLLIALHGQMTLIRGSGSSPVTVELQVQDQDGAPVVGATITAVYYPWGDPEYDDESHEALYAAVADAQGCCILVPEIRCSGSSRDYILFEIQRNGISTHKVWLRVETQDGATHVFPLMPDQDVITYYGPYTPQSVQRTLVLPGEEAEE